MFSRISILAIALTGAIARASVFEDCADVGNQMGGINNVVRESFVLLAIPGKPNLKMVHADGIDYGECTVGEAAPMPRVVDSGLAAIISGRDAIPSPVKPIVTAPDTPSPRPIAEAPKFTPAPSLLNEDKPEQRSPLPLAGQSPPKKNEAPSPSPEREPAATPTPPLRSRNLVLATPGPTFKGALEEKPLSFEGTDEDPSVRKSHGTGTLSTAEPRQTTAGPQRSISSDVIDSGLISAQQRTEAKWNEEAARLLNDPDATMASLEAQLRALIALDPDVPGTLNFGESTRKGNKTPRPARSTSLAKDNRSRTFALPDGAFGPQSEGDAPDQTRDSSRRKDQRSNTDDRDPPSQGAAGDLASEEDLLPNLDTSSPLADETSGISPRIVRGLMQRISRLHHKGHEGEDVVWAAGLSGASQSEPSGRHTTPARGLASHQPSGTKTQSRIPDTPPIAQVMTVLVGLLALGLLRRKRH